MNRLGLFVRAYVFVFGDTGQPSCLERFLEWLAGDEEWDPNDCIVSCTSCGRANRVPATRFNDNPKCGACKKALVLPS